MLISKRNNIQAGISDAACTPYIMGASTDHKTKVKLKTITLRASVRQACVTRGTCPPVGKDRCSVRYVNAVRSRVPIICIHCISPVCWH